MSVNNIRWIQRLNNYSKALSQLTKFIEKGELNELEKQGLIQAFEYTFELAWNTIKDLFEAQGETGILGSRDAFRMGPAPGRPVGPLVHLSCTPAAVGSRPPLGAPPRRRMTAAFGSAPRHATMGSVHGHRLLF